MELLLTMPAALSPRNLSFSFKVTVTGVFLRDSLREKNQHLPSFLQHGMNLGASPSHNGLSHPSLLWTPQIRYTPLTPI